MRIGLGSDQTGFECKERLKSRLAAQGHAVLDVCADARSGGACHIATDQLASAIHTGRLEHSVLICANAVGASVAANRHPGARAGLCHDLYSVRHGVQDDDMNLLVMGACVVTHHRACELADVFIQASYAPRRRAFGILPDAWRASSSTFVTISTCRWQLANSPRLQRWANRISPSCSNSAPAWHRTSSFCSNESSVRRSFSLKTPRRLSTSRLTWDLRTRRTSQRCSEIL